MAYTAKTNNVAFFRFQISSKVQCASILLTLMLEIIFGLHNGAPNGRFGDVAPVINSQIPSMQVNKGFLVGRDEQSSIN